MTVIADQLLETKHRLSLMFGVAVKCAITRLRKQPYENELIGE